jgi:hypothetical protein
MKKFYISNALPPKQKHLATVFRCYPRTLKEAFPLDQNHNSPFIYPMRWNFDWDLFRAYLTCIAVGFVMGVMYAAQ